MGRNRINIFIGFLASLILSLIILDIFVRVTNVAEVSYNDVYDDIGRGRRANLKYVMFNEGFSIGNFNKYRYLGRDILL